MVVKKSCFALADFTDLTASKPTSDLALSVNAPVCETFLRPSCYILFIASLSILLAKISFCTEQLFKSSQPQFSLYDVYDIILASLFSFYNLFASLYKNISSFIFSLAASRPLSDFLRFNRAISFTLIVFTVHFY